MATPAPPPPSSSSAAAARRRRVVLHFDLNRTVLMSDAAGGRSMENTVNYLLAECAWGRADASAATAAATWRCVSTEASVAPPSGHTDLITYKQFVDDALPYQSLADTTPDRLEAVKAFNKAAKKQRTALQSAFTAPGSPGESLAASFQLVMDKLHFPEGPAREAAVRAAAALPEGSRLQEAWREGRYYLLPSFLLFLAHVAERNASPTSRVDIRLVFRTFGDDIPEVAQEIELLADGTHPFALPGGAPLPAQYKLSTDGGSGQVGTFYRDAFGPEGSALAVGSLTKVPFVKQAASADGSDRVAAFYEGQPGVEIVRGFDAIHARVREMSSRHAMLALRDYWEWWSAHAEHGEYGKLLLVDASESEDADVAVFLDDHIEAHHAHIVDVRDVATGKPVAFEEATKRRFLQRVEPFAAITDDQYFIKLLAPLLQ